MGGRGEAMIALSASRALAFRELSEKNSEVFEPQVSRRDESDEAEPDDNEIPTE